MDNARKRPVVFVSSTCYDLSQVRQDLKDFFEEIYGFETMLSEFNSFPIDPCIGTFENCLSNVDQRADIFVLVIGNRYGYVTDVGKSITNLEYLHAKAKGIPIFVFVSKQIYNNLPLWRANKEVDFSSVVDTPQIFEFVSEIYEENHQWIYTYDAVKDIKQTMKNQLGLIFLDGLTFNAKINTSKYGVLNSSLPAGAIRSVIEQPYAWEYKFLAYVLKNEFDNLQKRKWDLQYGIFDGHSLTMEPAKLVDNISEKLNEIMKLVDFLSVLLNTAIQDAIGEPGLPSDLEMMIYVSKRLANVYERLLGWSLYFKSIQADDMFGRLLELLQELPKSILTQIDDFVGNLYNKIVAIPEIDDGETRKIRLICTLDKGNTDEIAAEIQNIQSLLFN